MTTNQYRGLVIGQIVAMVLVGIISAVVVLNAVPRLRLRGHLEDAIASYERGSDASLRAAEESLGQALVIDAKMIPALALLGRVSLQQGNLDFAEDAYKRLERALAERGEPTVSALNGMGCTLLLKAARNGGDRARFIEDARAKFREAVRQDPTNGDGHVNTAVCALQSGDLIGAAASLAQARKTANLGPETLISYYSAVGSLLASASVAGGTVAREVAWKFNDPDPELVRPGPMLVRAICEFEKALELAGTDPAAADLRVNCAIAKARRLVSEPLSRSETGGYLDAITALLTRHKDRLAPREVQLLCIALAISHDRAGYGSTALVWARRAATEGTLTPETSFYLGAILFRVAQSAKTPAERASVESEGAKYLRKSLEGTLLPAPLRLRALWDLGIIQWRANDPPGALKYLTDATALLPQAEREGGALPAATKGRLYRDLAVTLYRNGQVPDAADTLGKSVALSPDKAAADMLAKLSQQPTITGISTVSADKLPPSLPIVTATIATAGPVPVKKEEISVEIDGKPVVFTCGPDGRIFALPKKALPPGKFAVRITVSGHGKTPITATHEFEVKYPADTVDVTPRMR